MRIALVDFGSVWGIAWHSFGDSELSEAHNSAVNRVLKLGEQYDHVAVCLDLGPYRRLQTDPEYKANRPPQSEQQIAQRNRTIETLRGHGFCLLSEPGEEADDVIASALMALANMAKQDSKQLEIDVISADKDLTQCHADEPVKVRVVSPATGEVLDPMEKWGIRPSKVRDALAMAGDTSDNIKGIEGVAAGRAAALINAGLDVAGLRKLIGECERHVEAGGDARANDTDVAAYLATKLPAKMGAKIAQAIIVADRDGTLATAYELVKLRLSIPINVDAIFAPRKVTPKAEPSAPDAEWSEVDSDPPPPPAPVMAKIAGSASAEPKPKSTALVHAPDWNRQLEPQSLPRAWELAGHLDNARMFPDFGTQERVLAIVLAGRELGIGTMASLRGFHLVEGKPAMSAQLMLALCLKHPACEYFYPIESTAERAVWTSKRREWPKAATWEWTIEEARQACLSFKTRKNLPGMWSKYPKNMLGWRCVANAARAWYADVVGGLYTPEELREGF